MHETACVFNVVGFPIALCIYYFISMLDAEARGHHDFEDDFDSLHSSEKDRIDETRRSLKRAHLKKKNFQLQTRRKILWFSDLTFIRQKRNKWFCMNVRGCVKPMSPHSPFRRQSLAHGLYIV